MCEGECVRGSKESRSECEGKRGVRVRSTIECREGVRGPEVRGEGVSEGVRGEGVSEGSRNDGVKQE